MAAIVEIRTCRRALLSPAKRVRTIEGHAERDAQGDVVALSPVQRAFIRHFAFQCGYCARLRHSRDGAHRASGRRPIRRSEIGPRSRRRSPFICRCTGYNAHYYQAVRSVILATPGALRRRSAGVMTLSRTWRRWFLAATIVGIVVGAAALDLPRCVRAQRRQPPSTPPATSGAAGRARSQGTLHRRRCRLRRLPYRRGAPWSRPFEMPIGTLFATNISPDRETGIGGWTCGFHRAVRDGVGKGGRHLYPAMPCICLLPADDRRRRCGLRLSLTRGRSVSQPAGRLSLPLCAPRFLTFWDLLQLADRYPAAHPASLPPGTAAAIVDAGSLRRSATLAHLAKWDDPVALSARCCHRGASMRRPSRRGPCAAGLRAGTAGRLHAHRNRTAGRDGLRDVRRRHHSTQYLSAADAAASYLSCRPANRHPRRQPLPPPLAARPRRRHRLYLDVCAGCHGVAGEACRTSHRR